MGTIWDWYVCHETLDLLALCVSHFALCIVIHNTQGKTVQVISLLAALLEKRGTGADLSELHRRKKLAHQIQQKARVEQQAALDRGVVWLGNDDQDIASQVGIPEWAPILIVVPPSIVNNWVTDSKTWGHFGVEGFGSGRDDALTRVTTGESEILLCPNSLFTRKEHFASLFQIHWKVVVVDEFHNYKNEKGILSSHLRELRDKYSVPIIGLTGTLMQNNHKELWYVFDSLLRFDSSNMCVLTHLRLVSLRKESCRRGLEGLPRTLVRVRRGVFQANHAL